MSKYYDPGDVMRLYPLAPLSEMDVGAVEAIKQTAGTLYGLLDSFPPSAELTLAKRKLEESVMWAVKAVTA